MLASAPYASAPYHVPASTLSGAGALLRLQTAAPGLASDAPLFYAAGAAPPSLRVARLSVAWPHVEPLAQQRGPSPAAVAAFQRSLSAESVSLAAHLCFPPEAGEGSGAGAPAGAAPRRRARASVEAVRGNSFRDFAEDDAEPEPETETPRDRGRGRGSGRGLLMDRWRARGRIGRVG
jgi:hypothetical protein